MHTITKHKQTSRIFRGVFIFAERENRIFQKSQKGAERGLGSPVPGFVVRPCVRLRDGAMHGYRHRGKTQYRGLYRLVARYI